MTGPDDDSKVPPSDEDVLYLDADESEEEESLEDILKQAQESADRLAERQRARAAQVEEDAPESDEARVTRVAEEARAAAAEVLNAPASTPTNLSPPKRRGSNKESLAVEVEELRAQNEAAIRELNEYKEGLLRKQAEFENFRKRMQRDKEDFQKHAVGDVLKELLPVIDNLERALAVDSGADIESMRQGVELIMKQVQDTLARFGLKRVESVGHEFDPNFHEAVSSEPSEEHPSNTVVAELQKGYVHHDRLLRAAFVKVSAGPGPDGDANASDG